MILMAKQGPPLGAKVVFSHYYDRPTAREVEERALELDEEEGTISLMRRENPDPTKPAVVVGICRVAAEAPVEWSDGTGDWYAAWHNAKKGTFYAVKHTLRGRRFLVKLEDLDGLP